MEAVPCSAPPARCSHAQQLVDRRQRRTASDGIDRRCEMTVPSWNVNELTRALGRWNTSMYDLLASGSCSGVHAMTEHTHATRSTTREHNSTDELRVAVVTTSGFSASNGYRLRMSTMNWTRLELTNRVSYAASSGAGPAPPQLSCHHVTPRVRSIRLVLIAVVLLAVSHSNDETATYITAAGGCLL